MKTLTKKQISLVLITLTFCQLIHAQAIDPPERNLQFITSDEYETLDPDFIQYMEESIPTHIAVLEFKEGIRISRSSMEFQSFRGEKGLVIDSNGARLYYGIIHDRNITPLKLIKFMFLLHRDEQSIISFFANSEQHAHEIVEAYIKSLDNETNNHLKELRNELETYQQMIKEGQKVISKMEVEYNGLKTRQKEIFKEYAQANYINEERIDDIAYITKVRDEFAHSLREVDVELVGLDAKVDSINQYKLSGTIIDDETLIKLNQILISTDIERAGVLARKKAVTVSLKQVNQISNLILSCSEADANLYEYKKQFNIAPQKVSELKMILENPPERYRYAEIKDDKVIIKPVKQD
jgi:hypothetical protein